MNQSGFLKKTSTTVLLMPFFSFYKALMTKKICFYLCFFDLQKTFDTAQYPTLLKNLWLQYKRENLETTEHQVHKSKLCYPKEETVTTVEVGRILKGSKLSPKVFLMVTNSMLQKFDRNNIRSHIGSSVHCGAFQMLKIYTHNCYQQRWHSETKLNLAPK